MEPYDPLGEELPVRGGAFPVAVGIGRPDHEPCDGIPGLKRRGQGLYKRIEAELIKDFVTVMGIMDDRCHRDLLSVLRRALPAASW